MQPNQADCDGCADNPLAAAPNETVTTIVIGLANVAIGLCVIALLVLSWRRFRRATPALRRTMAPLVGTASLAGVLFLVGLTVSVGPEWLQLAVGICFVTVMTLVPVAFLIGLLRDRLQRTSSIQGLVIRLAGAADHEQLRSILAEALRDPDLTIAFWFPERQTYVDPHGHPVDVPERGVTVVERDGEPIARLLHDPALDEDPQLLETVAAAAAIGLERARLEAELRARLDELRASRARIVETAYHARRRLERDLHDGAQQRLVALSLTLRMIRSRVGEDESTVSLVEGASTELAAALAELRELARGIHPAILTDRGLDAALQALADRSPVPADLDVQSDLGLPPAHEAALYFVASEALANVAKYAGATSASVRVWAEADAVAIEIADDGKGGADPGQGSGLAGLRDRVEAMDGRFGVTSPPGEGTTVRATLPVAPPAPTRRAGASAYRVRMSSRISSSTITSSLLAAGGSGSRPCRRRSMYML